MRDTSYYQYRVTVNGSQGETVLHIPENWSQICDVSEARGWYSKLERRLVTDPGILPLLVDPTGYVQVDENTVICPWEILAEADFIGS